MSTLADVLALIAKLADLGNSAGGQKAIETLLGMSPSEAIKKLDAAKAERDAHSIVPPLPDPEKKKEK